MQCPRCQHENPPHARFCLECGARFVACAQCGTQLPAGARFCLECGRPTDRHGTEPARFASPQSYTPCHLGLGLLSRRTGDRAKAAAHLASAGAMYREMGMRLGLDEAEARMRELA